MGLEIVHQLIAALLLWSLVALGASVVGLYVRPSDFWRSFWFMTGMWALVDGGLAWSSLVRKPGPLSELAPLLLFNAGLDVVYLVVAAILLRRKSSNLRGFGFAISIQGAFLLAFDLYFWWRCTTVLQGGL